MSESGNKALLDSAHGIMRSLFAIAAVLFLIAFGLSQIIMGMNDRCGCLMETLRGEPHHGQK